MTPPSKFLALLPGSHQVQFFSPGVTPPLGTPVASLSFVAQAGELSTLVATTPTAASPVFILPGQLRESIRVPYALAPQVASDAHAGQSELIVPPEATQVSAVMANSGARNNPSLSTKRPLVGAFELSYQGAA